MPLNSMMMASSGRSTPYIANAVSFDGTNDYLTRGGGLTGASDSKLVTGSFFLRMQGADGNNLRLLTALDSLGGTAFDFRFGRNVNDSLFIIGENASSVILSVNSSDNTIKAADGWIAVAFSFDMSDAGKRHLYLGETSNLAVNTYTDSTIDFTPADWAVGALGDGSQKLAFDVADLRLWPGQYIDLSQASNRRLFYSVAGRPVDPSVAIGALGTPLIQLSGPTADWHTNKGSGDGFTENGALTDADSSPSD